MAPLLVMLASAVAACGAPSAPLSTDLGDGASVRLLAPDVWLYVSERTSDHVASNSLVVSLPGGPLLVDPPWDEPQTHKILDWTQRTLGRPDRGCNLDSFARGPDRRRGRVAEARHPHRRVTAHRRPDPCRRQDRARCALRVRRARGPARLRGILPRRRARARHHRGLVPEAARAVRRMPREVGRVDRPRVRRRCRPRALARRDRSRARALPRGRDRRARTWRAEHGARLERTLELLKARPKPAPASR